MPIIADVTPSAGPTLSQLVTEVVTTVQGFSVAPDKLATLKVGVTASDLTMTVLGDASPGIIEIEDELIYVTQVDQSSGTLTIHPRGRGWLGTTAAAHSTGEVVVDGPTLPRSRAVMLINEVLQGLYPVLFGVGSVTGLVDGPQFELPEDATLVLDVRLLDDEGNWQRVRRWETENSHAGGTTTRGVRLPSLADGDTVQVIYGTRPLPLVTNGQYWSETGLSQAAKDIVVTGTLARFAKTLDLGRLTDRFTTPRGDSQQPQLGAGFAMARQLDADYKAALDREASALRESYPARAHFTR